MDSFKTENKSFFQKFIYFLPTAINISYILWYIFSEVMKENKASAQGPSFSEGRRQPQYSKRDSSSHSSPNFHHFFPQNSQYTPRQNPFADPFYNFSQQNSGREKPKQAPRQEESKQTYTSKYPEQQKLETTIGSFSNLEEMNRAFGKWALNGHHPDKGGDSEAFKEVSSLRDQVKKLNRW